ncbi:hypothetical protein Q2T41_19045 [Maribacter confluentis]|uniref:DUF3278 domain-containing protein n=1 Tax=Maribacter confluentis TaxID=1656093 RepID=A0ABT8RIW2_9FLAO|nr:hypothetical protein [Maribacter confluentis]MDO1511055.1 hypothetical protein [Maribacter confluentis]MDO1514757.1 hypothetical protein [Maribacter confluentis]
MELEELQSAWVQMGNELERQKKLTNTIILNMTKEKYQNKFKSALTLETIGAVVCFALALLFLYKFNVLDTWYLRLCGILTIGYMVIFPILVLDALRRIKNLDLLNGSYKANLSHYLKSKNRLLRIQQIAMGIGMAGMVFILPTFSKISSGKDIFMEGLRSTQWIFLTITLMITLIFCLWGYRGYMRLTKSAQEILKELD